jgi:hypothetical protein
MDNTAQLNKQILKASKEGQVFIKNEKGNLVPVDRMDLVMPSFKLHRLGLDPVELPYKQIDINLHTY